jgi:hypothetical protein
MIPVDEEIQIKIKKDWFLRNLLSGAVFVEGHDGDGVDKVVAGVPRVRTGSADAAEKVEAALAGSGNGDPTSFGQKHQVVECGKHLE